MTPSATKIADGNVILLVEDQDKTRVWLQDVLAKTFAGAQLVACSRKDEALDTLEMLRASGKRLWLAIIDINLPDGSGVDVVSYVASSWPDAAAVVATIYDDDAHLMRAIAAGARGYLLKSDPAEVLVGCLHRLARGEPATSPAIALRILAHFRDLSRAYSPRSDLPQQQALTPRETEVLTLLARGYTVAESARELGLSPQTVATYVRTIYSKLSVSNRAQAVIEAHRRGLG